MYHVGLALPPEVTPVMILYNHPATLISPGFRIYLEWDALDSDVRLTGMGDPVSERPAPAPVTSYDLPQTPTAYDRVDDRTFPEDVSPQAHPPVSAVATQRKSGSLRRDYRV